MSGTRSTLRTLTEGLEGLVLLVLCVSTWPLTRRWLTDLGATRAEREASWPGDALVPTVDRCTTRAIGVRAAARDVWPWLVQLGLHRGGFHSYELVERLGGVPVRNVDRIVPALQDLSVGDSILLHPSAPPLVAALVSPPHHLCFRTWRDERDLAERDPQGVGSWSLYVVDGEGDGCRLVLRAAKHDRRPRRRTARLLGALFEDPLDLVMEQRLLRTVRCLAQRSRKPVG